MMQQEHGATNLMIKSEAGTGVKVMIGLAYLPTLFLATLAGFLGSETLRAQEGASTDRTDLPLWYLAQQAPEVFHLLIAAGALFLLAVALHLWTLKKSA
ncbi:hypothetical protein [Deinococcus misasensis]|uniref:hypothetical protein n=1 Tax=Deinococcus misasensis TaxID=392413 RepID=UPI0005561BD5|nr:hypothetical protein [Deinococcus misasensis]